jgi:hypothetical protein
VLAPDHLCNGDALPPPAGRFRISPMTGRRRICEAVGLLAVFVRVSVGVMRCRRGGDR